MRLTIASLLALMLCSQISFANKFPLPKTKPEKVGMSSERVQRIDDFVQSMVEEGKHPGASLLVSRKGKLVSWSIHGVESVETNKPVTKDTIFRIFSMGKPINAVAAMILVERGLIGLDDPVADTLPELKTMKLLSEDGKSTTEIEPKITLRHLLSHTAGIPYLATPESRNTRTAQTEPMAAKSLDEFIQRIAQVPLQNKPGERWTYGMGQTVTGLLIERLAGVPYDQFVKDNILTPLKMHDTGFFTTQEQKARQMQPHTLNAEGKLEIFKVSTQSLGLGEFYFPAAGEGMFSTAGDYMRFAQMLLNYGELDGTRILSRKTIEYMTENQLSHLTDKTHGFSAADGYGLGIHVNIYPGRSTWISSKGSFGWSGYASTHLYLDPKEELAIVFMTQHVPTNQTNTQAKIYNVVSAAIAD